MGLAHSVILRRVRAASARRTFRNRGPGCGRGLGCFRGCQRLGQLAARHRHLAAMHRAKSPALIVSVELQAQRGLGRLIDEDPDALIAADDGSDQHEPQLGRRRARRHWRRFRRGLRSHGWWWRPPRGREDRPLVRIRQHRERNCAERIAAHRLPPDGRPRWRGRIVCRFRRLAVQCTTRRFHRWNRSRPLGKTVIFCATRSANICRRRYNFESASTPCSYEPHRIAARHGMRPPTPSSLGHFDASLSAASPRPTVVTSRNLAARSALTIRRRLARSSGLLAVNSLI